MLPLQLKSVNMWMIKSSIEVVQYVVVTNLLTRVSTKMTTPVVVAIMVYLSNFAFHIYVFPFMFNPKQKGHDL